MTNAIVYYHKNCLDGFISALICAKFIGFENVVYKPLTYGDVSLDNLTMIEECFDKDLVFVLDFSFTKEVLVAVSSLLKGKMVIIDHHETVFKDLGLEFTEQYLQIFDNIDVYLSPNKKSGAILSYDFFKTITNDNETHKVYDYNDPKLLINLKNLDNSYPHACSFADDGDRWVFKYSNATRCFRAGMFSYMSEWVVNKDWLKIFDYDFIEHVLAKGKILDTNNKNLVESLAKEAKNITFYEWNVNIINANAIFTSELGNLLAKTKIGTDELPDFALVWYYNNKQRKVIASLRSIGDFNVSEVASKLNGGGHKNAAGFSISMEAFLTLAKDL